MSESVSIDATSEAKVARRRLKTQIDFYKTENNRAHKKYVLLKSAQIVLAAGIPIVTTIASIRLEQPWIIAGMGASVVALESFQQVGRYHENHLRYAVAMESLKREKYLHEVGAGPYAKTDHPDRLLEENVEAIVTRETGTWASEGKQQAPAPTEATPTQTH